MKQLKDRWFTDSGFELYRSIIKSFLENGDISELPGLMRYNDRWDLRGITLVNPLDSKIPLSVKNYFLENIDLSYATLYESVWETCSFNNIIFSGIKADHSKFWACRFENSLFEKAQLNEVLMNGILKGETGHYKNINFVGTDIRGTVYANTLFEKCNFFECKLDQVDFGGSRFVDCKFSGKLNEVCFRGRPAINRYLFKDRTEIANEMCNVDFSEATMESVMFLESIDLNHCIFPNSDNYIIIKNNRNKIFEEARKIIESTWSGMNKKLGQGLIDQYYLHPKAIKNNGELVDKHYLLRTDKTFGETFFNLIKGLNDQLNSR